MLHDFLYILVSLKCSTDLKISVDTNRGRHDREETGREKDREKGERSKGGNEKKGNKRR